MILFVAACDTASLATETPTDVPLTIIAPSATVAPIPPTVPTSEAGNVADGNKFTPGALPVSGGNSNATITPTPAPTQPAIPMTIIGADGLAIAGTFYIAPQRPAPAVLLLHMQNGGKEAWQPFAAQLQKANFNVLAIDLRGHGDTGGQVDWQKAPADLSAVLAQLRTLPGVDATRISVIGASIGANLALGACATTNTCRSVVLISPALDYQGVKGADAMTRYGSHPALIIASREDKPSGTDSATLDKLAKGDHTLQLYPGAADGIELLSAQPTLGKLIIDWLTAH